MKVRASYFTGFDLHFVIGPFGVAKKNTRVLSPDLQLELTVGDLGRGPWSKFPKGSRGPEKPEVSTPGAKQL